jgi:hypothetical protein
MVHSIPRRTIPPEFLRALQFNSGGCTRETKLGFTLGFRRLPEAPAALTAGWIEEDIDPIENVVDSAPITDHTGV